ncbi:MAG: PAS domain S-box protein [Bacteroidota bacterium]|nr:PAS domain S-box protein [Bacteroidota bacterium]
MDASENKTKEQLLKEVEKLTDIISQLKNKENESIHIREALEASEERYKGIVETTANCIAVYKPVNDGQDFVFVDFNPMAEKIERISKEKVIGKKVTELFPGVKEYGLFKVFQNVLRTGKLEHFPLSVYKDDRIMGYRENYVYKLSSGEIVAVYDDITEQKQIEAELTKYREDLENIVEERTKELQEKNEELKHFNKLFVGREFRIKELRDRVKELESRLGIE